MKILLQIALASCLTGCATVTVAATLLAEDFEHKWADNARADATNGWLTRVFGDPNTPDGGPWFLSAARRAGSVGEAPGSVTGLGFQGAGFIDDLVET